MSSWVLCLPCAAGQVTADDLCPLSEQRRRRAARSCAYFARVLINGHVVCTSNVAPLSLPSFTVPLQIQASVALHRRPTIVVFELWQTGWLNRRVASVPIPIPLAFTAESVPVESVEPFDDWLCFTSTTPMPQAAVQFMLPSAEHVPGRTVSARYVCGENLSRILHVREGVCLACVGMCLVCIRL